LRPDIFWPQPAVDSAVVRIRPDRVRREAAGDLQRLRRLVSGLFTHRRKQTARAMVMAGLAPDRPAAETMLARAGIEPALRPEAVPLSKMLALAQLVS
jgi:16S rRNA (adenine1518-N6/adenine1519-N6)-dimethyltransferase